MTKPTKQTRLWTTVLLKLWTQTATTLVVLTLAFPIGFVSSHAEAQETPECITSQTDSWVCGGDPAWADGYLIGKDAFADIKRRVDLGEAFKDERDQYRSLAEEFQAQRDLFKVQRDEFRRLVEDSRTLREEYKGQRDRMEEELVTVEKKFIDAAAAAHEFEVRLHDSYEPWEVGLIAGGTGLAAILAGIGIGALVFK